MSGHETTQERVERLNAEIDRLCERLSALDHERIEVEETISRLQHERQELLRQDFRSETLFTLA